MEKAINLLEGRLHKGTPDSVGWDLFATEPTTVFVGKRVTVPVGVRTKLAKFVVGLICDRSGLANNYGITVLAGVIDSDYDKEWKVILLNTGTQHVAFSKGDRIAQVLFFNTLQDIQIADKEKAFITYGDQQRTDGFGSTGN